MNDDIRRILSLIVADDPAAADEVDALADRLRALAATLRSRHESPWIAPSGMSDRVKINVVGPDGSIRQSTDTGSN